MLKNNQQNTKLQYIIQILKWAPPSPPKKQIDIRRSDISKLHKLYHCKIYAQNKKSYEKFIKQIQAVCKKTSYLHYQWAKDISIRLKSSNNEELYSEYQAIFQENCRRQGQHELIFYAVDIRRHFLRQITEKYDLKRSTLHPTQLKSLIFQCKCYFMVMNWFHKISSLDDSKINMEQSQQQIFVEFNHEDIVYEQIIQVASKTYLQYLEKESISRVSEEDCYPSLVNQDTLIELRNLKRCDKFHQKEKIFLNLQNILFEQNDSGLHQNMEILEKMFGKSKIFAHLLVMRQLGSGDVSKIWEKIYGSKYDSLLS